MSQHEAVFMAEVFSKAYAFKAKSSCGYFSYFNPNTEYVIKEVEGEFIEDRLIWDGEIAKPHLKVGDTIHLHEYGESVEILAVTRSTDDSVIYQTNYKFDLVENENTKLSYLEAEADKKKREEILRVQEERKEAESESKKSWWQRLKGWLENV